LTAVPLSFIEVLLLATTYPTFEEDRYLAMYRIDHVTDKDTHPYILNGCGFT
jgi:hypothetical protein